MDTRKVHSIGLMLAGAIIFIGSLFLFGTIYATANEPTTISGIVGLSTIAFQPWLSALLCLIGTTIWTVGLVRLVSNDSHNHPTQQ